MAKNMQKHQWVRSAYTLTCLMSSNLILSQAFLTNALASEAVNDLIQSSDKIKSSADGNDAAGGTAPQQTESKDATSTAPQQTGGNDVTSSTAPQQTESNNAFSNDTSKQTSSGNVSHGSTPQTGGNYASGRVKYRQTGNGTAGGGSSKPIDSSTENAQSRVPAVKKLNFTDVAFGILAPGNPQSQGRYIHLYQFEGRENQLVQVRLVGSNDDRPTNNLSLKPYLVLLDPNNQVVSRKSSEGADGQLKQAFMPVRLPMKGTYTVAVTSEKPGAIGRYSLALREDRGSYALDKSGELTSRSITSQLDDGSSKPVELQGKNAQSSELSSTVAPQPNDSASKHVELQDKSDQSSELSSTVALQPDDSASKHVELQGKSDQSSELSSTATPQPNDSASKPFELQGKKNQLVNIRVDSTTEQFHPYAVLMNSKAQVIAMSEATDSKYSASIDRAMLPQDDKYYVVVNSSTPQIHGKYRLTVY